MSQSLRKSGLFRLNDEPCGDRGIIDMSQSLRKSGLFRPNDTPSYNPMRACRNPFVNQVFSVEGMKMKKMIYKTSESQSLRKSGLFRQPVLVETEEGG